MCGCGSPTTTQTAKPAAPAPGVTSATITIQDYRYEPPEIHAAAGQKLHLKIRNLGKEEHGIEFDMPSGNVEMPFHLKTGETKEFDLPMPAGTGTYNFHCPVGNHYSRGMEGSIKAS